MQLQEQRRSNARRIEHGCCADAAAATYTCGDHVVAEAEADAVAVALAQATVQAVTQVYATCILDDGAYACADASAFITDSAHAVAKVIISGACM
jgi:hypothetical protein